jgi:mono/diheme cytochrome c family protein
MTRANIGICSAVVAILGWPPATWGDNGLPDLASKTRAIFATKCAVCHGPDLAKPKGRFGYVTDLRRVASNREMVVPSSPDESELWELVRRDEMPPADSPAGPLSPEQKQAIRAWIEAGAPSGAAADALADGATIVPAAPAASDAMAPTPNSPTPLFSR